MGCPQGAASSGSGRKGPAVLVIFSTLDISAGDRAWIERVRVHYDPQQRMVEPHFTFVFPFDGLSADEVLSHVQTVASEASPIPFRLSQAAAVRDPFGPRSHLFLLPDEGVDDMRALHARLYTGLLAQQRHPTAQYAPHVTVGAFVEHAAAELAAEALGVVNIQGKIDSVLIADFDGKRVTVRHKAPLGGVRPG